MDAVKFLKEWRRMCITCDNNCYDACAERCIAPCPVAMDEMSDEYIKFTVETVERWSAEHPQKTRLDDLKEKYPHFELRNDGYPVMLPRVFGYCGIGLDPADCMRCSKHGKDCWDTPLEVKRNA